jgi:hypothetical protein
MTPENGSLLLLGTPPTTHGGDITSPVAATGFVVTPVFVARSNGEGHVITIVIAALGLYEFGGVLCWISEVEPPCFAIA